MKSHWIALVTNKEYKAAKEKAVRNKNWGYTANLDWYDHILRTQAFHFDDDAPFYTVDNRLKELEALKPKVDDVVALLTFLFLQGSESQQLDMFERFLAANLGKGKIVHFWSE
jgi:hypothetical protein